MSLENKIKLHSIRMKAIQIGKNVQIVDWIKNKNGFSISSMAEETPTRLILFNIITKLWTNFLKTPTTKH